MVSEEPGSAAEVGPRPFSTNALSVHFRPVGLSVCPGPRIARSQPAGRTESEPRAQDACSTPDLPPAGKPAARCANIRVRIPLKDCATDKNVTEVVRKPGRTGREIRQQNTKTRHAQNSRVRRRNFLRCAHQPSRPGPPRQSPLAAGPGCRAPRRRPHSPNTPAVTTYPAIAAGPDHLIRQAFAAGKRRR